ncbi:MAG: DUF721 domain-containing protein [Candidatus Moranbacteria bacterium]|nr:DUF721 domain-containing protein [Candidatus Moranbacteria bacterium]
MKKIGDIFASIQKKRKIGSISDKIDEKTVLFLIEKIILSQYGIRGRENIIPKSFKEKNIYILCRSSLWMNELWMNKDVIIRKLNQELGDGSVSDIRLTEMF